MFSPITALSLAIIRSKASFSDSSINRGVEPGVGESNFRALQKGEKEVGMKREMEKRGQR